MCATNACVIFYYDLFLLFLSVARRGKTKRRHTTEDDDDDVVEERFNDENHEEEETREVQERGDARVRSVLFFRGVGRVDARVRRRGVFRVR